MKLILSFTVQGRRIHADVQQSSPPTTDKIIHDKILANLLISRCYLNSSLISNSLSPLLSTDILWFLISFLLFNVNIQLVMQLLVQQIHQLMILIYDPINVSANHWKIN